jgi:hypothetical protein
MLSTAFLLAVSMVVGQAEGDMPENVRAAMRYLARTWHVEGNDNGKAFTATFTARWAPAKNCLTATFKSDTENATGISGRDPSTNDLVETLYLADGTRIENRYSHFSERVWEGTAIVQYPSGKIEKPSIRLEKDADGYTFTSKSQERLLVLKCTPIEKQKPQE